MLSTKKLYEVLQYLTWGSWKAVSNLNLAQASKEVILGDDRNKEKGRQKERDKEKVGVRQGEGNAAGV